MKIKNILNSILSYTPKEEYDFELIDSTSNENPQYLDNEKKQEENTKIYPSLAVNLEYMKTKYNLLINSDIISREFTINARGKQYNAFIFYIDGMVNSQIMDQFVLEPLMMRNRNNLYEGPQSKIVSEAVANNITVRKVKKFDLASYIMSCLMPQNSAVQVTDFKDAISGINSGNCALFVDTLNLAFDIEVKGFKQRSVDKPQNEVVIKGPHEAFVENIRTNTSLLRRIINSENLIIENIEVGNITKTKCGLVYIKDLTNQDLVAEVKYRLNNLAVDSLLSSGQLEQLISSTNTLSLPQTLATERPDKAASYLLDGRVIVIVNGSPYVLIMPAVLKDFLTSPDDKNLKTLFANFVKGIRLLATFITILLPGLYISIANFHQELLPTELLYSILSFRENVPFPMILEILLLELSFELIREAGLRVPSPIGSTISIVGALVLGQAAVSAGIVSPILIIVVAITGIASFAIPDYSFAFHIRLFRFLFLGLGYTAGFFGIGLGLLCYMFFVVDTNSFGIPFTASLAPFEDIKGGNYYLPPIWKREYRASFINPQKTEKQNKISMKWKYPQ